MNGIYNKNQNGKDDTKIYLAIKEAIQNGAFPPGYRLVERDLAKQFGASRTPVRTAINRLTIEGYIDQSHYKGAVVKRLSAKDIVHLLELRESLEGMACRLAAKHAGEEDKIELVNIIKHMEESVEKNDFIKYYSLSGELHKKIMECCDNPPLFELAERVNLQTTRYQFRNILVPGRIKESTKEHAEIVDSIIKGDGDEAEKVMRKHISIVKEMLFNSIQVEGDLFLNI
ncbi:MAG TPA: GntR family transcriptional regulator [Patescibacteria group bacterium]|nr:GntR family transcriptional regulator [Patescibacteria group bacterium]